MNKIKACKIRFSENASTCSFQLFCEAVGGPIGFGFFLLHSSRSQLHYIKFWSICYQYFQGKSESVVV